MNLKKILKKDQKVEEIDSNIEKQLNNHIKKV